MNSNIYLERYAISKTYIEQPPPENLGMAVVIPAYKEPGILSTLLSLLRCEKPACAIEVIVVLNFADSDDSAIKKRTYEQRLELEEWARKNNSDDLTFHVILEENIPYKTAGPGLARKIGMDEAVKRFEAIGNDVGIMASLDADSRVGENYLVEICRHWQNHPQTTGVSIWFEHPTAGDFEKRVYQAIVDYELHLRYYVGAQAFSGFPMAYQTVGSSFAVSSKAYQKQGGMNKRKAGEDFYFLHKIIPLGYYFNLNTTIVRPSPRASDRVPFGTGRSVSEYLSQQKTSLYTYNIEIFKDLRMFLSNYRMFFHLDEAEIRKIIGDLPQPVYHFLVQQNFPLHLGKINKNSAREETFAKGFFRWFNAFQLMKYVHFARDGYHPNQKVGVAARALLELQNIKYAGVEDNLQLLEIYRETDRNLRQGQ